MIVAARQARTANTHAPLQERAATATGRIRDLYRPSMRYWAHARYTQQMSGAVAAVLDASGRGTVIDQATASKQPLAGTTAGARAWVFDGVNDCLVTSSVDLSALSAATLCLTYRAAATTGGTVHEMSPDQNNVGTGWGSFSNDGGVNRMSTGGRVVGGYQFKDWSFPAQTWNAMVAPWDRAAAAADELKVWQSGVQQTTFLLNLTFDTAANFGNFQHFFGSRNNGTSYAANCSIASVLLLTVALGAADAATLSLLMRQAAGVV